MSAQSWAGVAAVIDLAGPAALVAAIEVRLHLVKEPYLRGSRGAGYLDHATRVARSFPPPGRHRTPTTLTGVGS